MITKHVKEVAQKRGVRNAHQLALTLGVADNVGVRLWNEDFARLDFITLDKLCRALKCQPGTLFKFEHDETESS